MVMSVALFVCQLNTVDRPCWMLSGLADNVAVGAGADDGGVTGCATFAIFLLLHPATRSAAVSANKEKKALRLKVNIGFLLQRAQWALLASLLVIGFRVPDAGFGSRKLFCREAAGFAARRDQQRRTAFACPPSNIHSSRADDERSQIGRDDGSIELRL